MTKSEYTEVGIVRSISHYLVKSMAGESITSSWIGWYGLVSDRKYALVKADSIRGFPWLTMRNIPKLVTYRPYFVDPDNPSKSEIMVCTPEGIEYCLTDPSFIEHVNSLSRYNARLIHLWRGTFDALNVSMITTRSIASIEQHVGLGLDTRRFRANIVIEASNVSRNYPEEDWIDKLVIFGEQDDAAQVRVNRKDQRCMVVNLNPDTSSQNPDVLKSIVKHRQTLLGVYGSVEHPGMVRVGDVVRVKNT